MNSWILLSLFVVNVKASLTVSKQASEGTNATLQCRYQIGSTAVQWSRNGIGMLTTCNIPGTCLPMENKRYFSTVSRSLSTFTILDARYIEDTGNWTCTVNTTQQCISLAATKHVTVSRLPNEFNIVKGPTEEIIIPKDGMELEARAFCLYPRPQNVYLYYKIKGDDNFNIFSKRKAKIYFSSGNEQNCADHEEQMLVLFKIYKDDFEDLTVSFKIQYRALTGVDVQTEVTPNVVFPGIPCQTMPCKNGGKCETLSPSHYTCHCIEKYTGKNCENLVDPCVSIPCKNNGICLGNKELYTYTCRCADGYYGETCEKEEKDIIIGVTVSISVIFLIVVCWMIYKCRQ